MKAATPVGGTQSCLTVTLEWYFGLNKDPFITAGAAPLSTPTVPSMSAVPHMYSCPMERLRQGGKDGSGITQSVQLPGEGREQRRRGETL